MSSSVLPEEWGELDSWWAVFTESNSTVLSSEMTKRIDDGFLLGHWKGTDTWWDQYAEDSSLAEVTDRPVNLDQRFTQREWNEIDTWWDSHLRSQQDELAGLQQVLDEVQEEWQQSGGRFENGPLTTDWKSDQGVTEPLRTYQEENWSQWLGHLLHSAPPEFLINLFGDEFDIHPDSVEREVYLPYDEGTSRYADIVLFYKDRGVSIEVKKGDKNYSKTIDTASLIELHYAKEWEHTLLLPKYRTTALRRSFPEKLEESDENQLVIQSKRSEDIKVLYWREISSAIRKELQSDSELNPHWEASAYLFCTLIEQEVAGFAPKPSVDKLVDSHKVVQASTSLLRRNSTIEEQIEYLRGTTEDKNHE